MPTGAILTLNSDFSANAIGFVPPVQANLEYWNYFSDSSKIARNLVFGKPAPTIVGSPVAGANFTTFTSLTNYLSTGLLDQAEATLLAVARVNTGGTMTNFKYAIGNYNGGDARAGSNLLFDNSTNNVPRCGCARSNSSSDFYAEAVGTTPDAAASFAFYSGRMGAAAFRWDDKTHNLGVVSTAIPSTTRSTPNGQPYRIGSSGAAAPGGGRTDIAFAAIYSRVLTDAELNAVYARVQAYLATKSIAV